MQSFIDYSDEMFDWEDALDPFSAQDVAERVSEAIEVAYDDFRRDVGYWQEGDTLYALSGGLSWGDEPTDAMRDLMIFNYLQVWAKGA